MQRLVRKEDAPKEISQTVHTMGSALGNMQQQPFFQEAQAHFYERKKMGWAADSGGGELRPDWTAAVSRFQLTCRLAFRGCLCSILVVQLPILHIVNAGHNFKQKGAHQVLWKKVTFLYPQNKRESDGIPSPQKPPSFKTRPSVSNHKIWQPVLLSKVFRFLLQLIKLPFELHQ